MKKLRETQAGQALIEYIIIFSFMALIAVKMSGAFAGYLNGTVGSMAFFLSQQLSVGVCKKLCFYEPYTNNQE